MKTLYQTLSIGAEGTAESQQRTVYKQINFASPENILVQLHLSSVALNRQTQSFWAVNVNIYSYEYLENGTKKTVNIPHSTFSNNLEIKNCNWVKIRLEYQNGHGSGIINIFKESFNENKPVRFPWLK